MMSLKSNLKRADEIAKNILMTEGEIARTKSEDEKEMLRKSHSALIDELRIINNAIPGLLGGEEKITIDAIHIDKKERARFLGDMKVEREMLKSLEKRIYGKKEEVKEDYRSAGFLTRISSGIFSRISLSVSQKKSFEPINKNLRKANMPYLLSTYISMALFMTMMSFIIGTALSIILFSSGLIGIALMISIIILVPIISFSAAMTYPYFEASSNGNKIEEELPFAVIHMSAISGSGVEPTRVFKILAKSPEYPALGREMKKLVNYINFYGYDLTTALSQTAKSTSSKRLSELLNGMAMMISTGGNLQEYLNKVSADTLLDYRLKRKKFVTIAETYADIYTGLLIAAPLMFMLLLTMINIIGGSFGGMNAMGISLIGIGAIALLNIGFLIFLEVSAPKS